VSTNNGLVTEKAHLVTELRETRDLYKTYEQKCSDLMKELHNVNASFQELKRANISHDENMKQRDDKIKGLKNELAKLNDKYENLQLDHGSLKVQYDKEKE
jgi:chromosome segregation ATPase